jgi:hypothetical protein
MARSGHVLAARNFVNLIFADQRFLACQAPVPS